MAEGFEISISYKTVEYLFPASLITTGYSYKILVEVFGKIISFEPDEERNFRAILASEDSQMAHNIDIALLEEISNTLISIFKD